VNDLRIPEGWTLEPLTGSVDQVLLRTPPPLSYMATIDFRLRGFRSGLVSHGSFVREQRGKRGPTRKKYEGRGWKQAIVDDAVAYLREVLA
jgi:hypothetical protein